MLKKRYLAAIALVFVPWGTYAASIRVHITDHQGAPGEAAEVRLVNSQSGEAQSKLSTANGEAEFDHLAAGTYQLKASRPRFVSSEADPVAVADSDVVVEIKMAPQEVIKRMVEDGNEAFKRRKYHDAAEQYAKALVFFPKDATMWAHLAKSEQMINKMDKAIESAKQAVKYDAAQYGRLEKEIVGVGNYEAGKKYLVQKEFSKAADSFSRSVKADPSYAPAFYGLALSYANQGKYPQALENVQQALKLDSGNAQYRSIEEKLKQTMASSSSK
jgi:tetratricopeptide (TPR) repeat protein